MKKIFFTILLLTSVLIGCGTSPASHAEATAGNETVIQDNRATSPAIEVTESTKVQKPESITEEIAESDIIDKGYLYENTIGDSLYFVVVTNNGKTPIEVSGNGTAMDASGKVIGADDLSIDVIGPGETSIGYYYFDGVTGINTVDYNLSYKPSRYFYPVLGNLSVVQNLNDQNLTVTITNNGKTAAQFVEAYALFFDSNGKVIRYDSTYITDMDSEIKPGATLSKQLDCYSGYDHVELYLTGRSDGKQAEDVSSGKGNSSVDDILETTEYMYENSIGDSLYFVVVKNISSDAYEVGGNATAKDESGNIIGAANFSIDVLGAGETSIGYFYFDSVKNIASVEYQLTTGSAYCMPILKDLSVEQTINNKNVIITITNKGKETAEFVEAYALFFDANNKIINYDSTYVVDNDSQIKPGAKLSGQLDSYQNFDHVEVYLTGRRY